MVFDTPELQNYGCPADVSQMFPQSNSGIHALLVG